MHGLLSLTTLVILLAGCQQCTGDEMSDDDTLAPAEVSQYNGSLYATCKMRPSTSLAAGLPKVYGLVLFKQDYPRGMLKVLFRFRGFRTQSDSEPKAVHIHQYGDLQKGCDSTGGHYNPYDKHHPNHPGDFGNFESRQGNISAVIQSKATLFGGPSVIGRAVVIHEGRDDLGLGGDAGSLKHGNAGKRLACCVIGISTPNLWNLYYKQDDSEM